MTIDDNSSIYVGNLPYDIAEEGLRRVFYIYGAVLAVKIINDRTIGGKCYGFVTFANPRSAMQAIKEMDGKAIDGRVVKVNEVRTRGGRPTNFDDESFQHDMERSNDGDRGRDRGRAGYNDRQRHQEGRSQDSDRNRERGHDRPRDREYVDEERSWDYSRHMGDDAEQEHGRKREREWEKEYDKNIDQQRNNNHPNSRAKDKHQQLHALNRSRFDDHGSRELSLESLSANEDQGENNLAVSNRKLEQLRQEISQIEELVADKQVIISKLQGKCQKLEDSLVSAEKLTSRRHLQLSKLHKCYLQMRDYDEKFKKSEHELQWLINSTMIELGNNEGGIGDGVVVTNGRA